MGTQNNLNNTHLIRLIKDFRTEKTKDKQQLVYEELANARLLLPIISNDNNKIRMIRINDENGKEYLPVFTDLTSLKEFNNFQALPLTFIEFSEILDRDSSIIGVAINPYTENLVLTKENLSYLKSIQLKNSISFGIPKEYPSMLIAALSKLFDKDQKIEKAFLSQVVREGEISLLLLIDDSSHDKKIFKDIGKLAEQYLTADKKLDVMFLDTEIGKKISEDIEPFWFRA